MQIFLKKLFLQLLEGDVSLLFQEHEEDSHDQAEKGCDVIPLKGLALEHEHCHEGEHRQGDHFLNHLELHEAEGTAVLNESDPVGRDLGAVLEEGHSP